MGSGASSGNIQDEGIMRQYPQQQSRKTHQESNSGHGEKLSSYPDEMTLALYGDIKIKIMERFDNLQDAFLSIDTNRDGFISREEFQEVSRLDLIHL